MCQAWERSRHSVVTTAKRRRRAGGWAVTAELARVLAPTALTKVRRVIMVAPASISVRLAFNPTSLVPAVNAQRLLATWIIASSASHSSHDTPPKWDARNVVESGETMKRRKPHFRLHRP